MQIASFSTQTTFSSNYQNDQLLKKALMQVPSKDVDKVLKQIPADENKIKELLQKIDKGFEIYA